MRYPSSKSRGFAILVCGVILILIVATVLVSGQERWILLVGTALGTSLLLWIWFATFYEFKYEHLLLRMGPFFQRIPYPRITSARKFQGMMSSMALSSDMIELRHGKNYITGTTYISPKDRDGFLAELKTRCQSLKNDAGKDLPWK